MEEKLKPLFERSAGGVVTRRRNDRWEFLIIKDRFGRWSFPKGHLEEGESARDAARREVEEETGVRGKVLAPLGRIRYFFTREGRRIGKTVEWYLMGEEGGTPRPQEGEIEEVGWIEAQELDSLPTYPQMRDLVRRALEVLEGAEGGAGRLGNPDGRRILEAAETEDPGEKRSAKDLGPRRAGLSPTERRPASKGSGPRRAGRRPEAR